MKQVVVFLVLLLIAAVLMVGCGGSTPSTTAAATPAAATPAKPAVTAVAPITTTATSATVTAGQPVSGGILRVMNGSGPNVVGYYPEMGPFDEFPVILGVERLLEFNNNKELVPFLAESWEVSQDKKSIVFHIKKGIKFSDGAELTAQVAAWNYQLAKDSGRMQYNDKLLSIETPDDYTMKLNISNYNGMLIYSFGWLPLYSKKAFDDNGKDWARTHVVGTGPFLLKEFVRDDHMTWVRNPNYWQKGLPYLDGVEMKFIPDAVTASQMIQAKQADMWFSTTIRYYSDLKKAGLSGGSGFGNCSAFIPNIKDPNSKWQNQKLREAVEYAVDKEGIAKTFGFGYGKPMYQVAPEGEWGNDPEYQGRKYNPEKARQLLTEAGYPKGLNIKLLVMMGSEDIATAYKTCLDAVGINTDLDVADPGRFFGMVTGSGWPDLLAFGTGVDPPYLVTFLRFYGPERMFMYASYVPPAELGDIAQETLKALDADSQKAMTKKLVRYVADNCLIIPTFFTPTTYVYQPYVHTNYLQQCIGAMQSYNWWIEKH
jgi:peptide/nickel transport system substrate-binding protein